MALTIFFIITVFIAVMESAIPYLVKRTIVFGVSIPEGHLKDEKLVSYKKRYSLTVFCLSLATLALYFLWAIYVHPAEGKLVLLGTAIQFGILFISMALYFYFHARTIQRKKAQKWGDNVKQIKIVDLSIRSRDEMLSWYVYLLPMLITIGVIGYTVTQYSLLPEQIPTHWGPNGKPDSWTTKTPFSSIQLSLILLTMQVMFLGINEMTKRSGIKLSATSTEASRVRQLTLRKYSSWFMFIVMVVTTMLFTFLQFTTIHEGVVGDAIILSVPFLFIILVLIGTIIFALKVGKADEKIVSHPEDTISDFNEDQYWVGGLFYFNKNDPSIFVEKRFGVGWTLNFANPKGYLITFGPLIIIFLLTYLGS